MITDSQLQIYNSIRDHSYKYTIQYIVITVTTYTYTIIYRNYCYTYTVVYYDHRFTVTNIQ